MAFLFSLLMQRIQIVCPDTKGQHKITFKDAAGARQHVEGEHNRRETPLMAASIERMALGHAHQGSQSIGAA